MDNLWRARRGSNKWGKLFFKSSIALGDITFWNVFIFLKIIKKWWEIQKSKLNNYLTNWAFQKKFHNWFYRVVLFKNHLFFTSLVEILILLSIMWPHFPAKNRENRKTYDCLGHKVLPSCKVWAHPDKKLKSYF